MWKLLIVGMAIGSYEFSIRLQLLNSGTDIGWFSYLSSNVHNLTIYKSEMLPYNIQE